MTSASDPYLGIFSSSRLAQLGHSPNAVRRLVADGTLTRIRPGWFFEIGADADAIDAVRVGGILTASSGSGHHGMWTFGDRHLHVLVSRNASRLGLNHPALMKGRTICLHWAKVRISRTVPVADPLQIIIDSAHCQPRVTAVAMADSALNQHLISYWDLKTAMPRFAEWCDPGSQSGTETKVRVQLRSRGVRVRSQARIHGVGRVDVLVGDRLVIECDSREFHDGYQSIRDYERDQELIRRGYIVLRLRYDQVMYEWERVEALILDIVRARRHLWRSGTGANGTVLAL